MKHYLKLIRIENILMVAFMQLIVKYGFLNHIEYQDAFETQQSLKYWQKLTDFQYILMVLATICIMAGGYIINNIFDREADLINKPENVVVGTYISEKNAYNLYFALNVIGVGIGFYLSRVVNYNSFAGAFIICSVMLYAYSNGLKQVPLLGNAIIALLSSFSILIIIFFNLYPAMYEGNAEIMKKIFSILLDYAIFAFLLHFAREIIKTIEDYDGDNEYEINTVATAYGKNVAKYISIAVIAGLVAFLGYYIFANFLTNYYTFGYFIALMIAPLLFCLIKLFKAETKAEFSFLSKLLKLVMFTTILSLVVILVSMQYA